jgi:hypothetical protein
MIAPLEGAEGAMGVVVYGNQGKGGMGSPSDTPLAPYSAWGCLCFLVHFRVYGWGCAMAYYKVRIEVWCDWNPAESDLDDIAQAMGVGEAICTMRDVIAVVDRPQDIEDEEAMSFFGGSEGDADESQG